MKCSSVQTNSGLPVLASWRWGPWSRALQLPQLDSRKRHHRHRRWRSKFCRKLGCVRQRSFFAIFPNILQFRFILELCELWAGVQQEDFLCPNGDQKKLCEENKQEYVDFYLKWRFTRGTREQYKALIQGIDEVVPLEMLTKRFDHKELELVISGLGKILNFPDQYINTSFSHQVEVNGIFNLFYLGSVKLFSLFHLTS